MDFEKDVVRPPPTRRKTRPSACKCLAVTCGLFFAGLVISFLYIGFTLARSTYDVASNPHKNLLYNGTVTPDNVDTLTASQVVRPLIDKSTKFDVLLSIYARVANEETEHADEYAKEKEWDPEDYTGTELAIGASTHRDPVEIRWYPTEKIIHQEVVMTDMGLGHRDVEKTVSFDLPLKRFYDHFLYAQDVRVAIAIIPRVNSKLDRLEDLSDWIPQGPGMVPERISPEFMATTPLNNNHEDDTARWEALETIAMGHPLIEYHHRPNPCKANQTVSSDETLLDEEEDDLYASIMADEDDDISPVDNFMVQDEVNGDDNVNGTEKATGMAKGKDKAKDQGKLKSTINEDLHPYIVTRSHVYIINETRLFDRKAYDNAHKALRKHACGNSSPGQAIHRYRCHRTYEQNGHWSTRYVLAPEKAPVADESEGAGSVQAKTKGKGKGKELAYAPYLGFLDQAAGPKDVHIIPVTRHNCSNTTLTPSDPETFRVNYTIRFSSLTPARVKILDHFVEPHRLGLNGTETDRAELHNDWEQKSGVFGNRGAGTHPWRRLIIQFVQNLFLGLPIVILTLLYWYTRQTTRGINIPSTAIFALASMFKAIVIQWTLWGNLTGAGEGLLTVFFTAWELAPAIMMLKLIMPVEQERNGWFRFSVRRYRPTHQERNDMRKGTGYDWKIWVGVFALIFSFIYLPGRWDYLLAKPHLPPTYRFTLGYLMKARWISALTDALIVTGTVMQLAHNRSQGTFAGSYALTAYCTLAHRFTELVYYFPSVVGRFEVQKGLQWWTLLEVAVEAVAVWQAWKLPRVEQRVEDAEEE